MLLLLALIAVSTLACAACGGAIYAQRRERANGTAAALALFGFAYWGACQLFYHQQPDPGLALWIARASAPGWIFLGPLCLHAFMSPADVRETWLRWTASGLSTLSGIGMLVAISSPWVIADVRPASWGYGIVPGRLFPVAGAMNIAGAGLGLWISRRAAGRFSDAERRQRRWITLSILLPGALIGVTDVWLPLRGVLVPGLAPAVFGPLAVLALWLRMRIGYSPLIPAHVANEILEILPDGVALLHADDRIRLANNALGRLCGFSAARLEGVAIGDLLSESADGADRSELRGASGQPVPVALTSTEFRDRIGNPAGRVLVVRDLREMADLRSQLMTSARLATVGELAAGIAHEINNPLAFVRSNLSQLEEIWKQLRPERAEGERRSAGEAADAARQDLVRDVDELIEESIEGVDRAVEIVRSVKSFAHAGNASREITDLRPLLENVLRVASAQLRSRVNVLREYDDALPPVVCAPQQLRQVFLNLVVNAAQAVEAGGHVLVATRADGDHVIVSVADDGCGIAPEVIDRIFDPFFTTKAVGEGTGLGLGIAHQIVTSHGGEIQVESTPGQGTVFRVRLPAAPED